MADHSGVRAQLGKIVSSPLFVNSPRMSRFLRFVVETTLDGNGERIKEYVVAIEVFEKADDYDPQADSTVRTEPSKLRSRLTRYYDSEGQGDPVVITNRNGRFPSSNKRGHHHAAIPNAVPCELLTSKKG